MCYPSQLTCVSSPAVLNHAPVADSYCRMAFSPAPNGTNIYSEQHQCHQDNQAQRRIEAAIAHFTQAQNAVGIGKSLNELSALHLAQADYERSLVYSQAATAILEDTDAKYDYAIALYQLGVSHFELHHWTQAEETLEQALTQFYTLSALKQENQTLLYLGQIYAQQQKFLFALACYESVLDSLIVNPFLENRRDLLSAVLQAVAQLSRQTKAGKAAIAGFQSVLEEYSLAAYHLQISAHLQPSRQYWPIRS